MFVWHADAPADLRLCIADRLMRRRGWRTDHVSIRPHDSPGIDHVYRCTRHDPGFFHYERYEHCGADDHRRPGAGTGPDD